MPGWQSEKGFTLVELCVVIVVGSLIFLLLFGLLHTQWGNRRSTADESQMQKEAAVVLMRITEDIREASEDEIEIPKESRLKINGVEYYIKDGKLYLSRGEEDKILARQVITEESVEKTKPTFTYQSSSGLVYINLTFKGKKGTYDFQKIVKPRR